MRTIITAVAGAAVGLAILMVIFGLLNLSRESPTPEADERCLAAKARAYYAECMSRKLDMNELALMGYSSRNEYCRSGIGIAQHFARLYGSCPPPRNSN